MKSRFLKVFLVLMILFTLGLMVKAQDWFYEFGFLDGETFCNETELWIGIEFAFNLPDDSVVMVSEWMNGQSINRYRGTASGEGSDSGWIIRDGAPLPYVYQNYFRVRGSGIDYARQVYLECYEDGSFYLELQEY